MGCVVQAIGETRVTEVSVEIGKHISLLSNRALGPVLHSLIQMRVPHMGLAKIDPHYLCLTDTHAHTVSILLSFTAACISCALFLSSFSFPPITVMQKSICIFDPHRLLWIESLSLELCSLCLS